MDAAQSPSEAQIEELVSHVLALRMDFVQQLLASVGVPYSRARKGQLRERVRDAIAEGTLSVEEVVQFLNKVEPGGKQHVFMLRPSASLNATWTDAEALRKQLESLGATKDLLGAPLPLLMPETLELSSVKVEKSFVEIVGVEARRYTDRDEAYDSSTTSEDGLPVQLRAYVERIARSTVTLRWDTDTRHAALHITQATGRGLERDHYRQVAERFGTAVSPFLDFSQFADINLHKVIHRLGEKEQDGKALTRSRRGRWHTGSGFELLATSPSTIASVYDDQDLRAAIGEVATPHTGQSGNLYWLAGGDGNPLAEDLHLTIIAADSRVHFMVPSSPETVDYVLGQIRSLL